MAATVYEHLGTRRLYLSPRGGHTILVVSRAQQNLPEHSPVSSQISLVRPFLSFPPLLTIKNDWSLICLSHNAPAPTRTAVLT